LGEVELRTSFQSGIVVPRSCRPLVCLLALRGRSGIDRGLAAELLWPDSDGRHARQNLSTALWRLQSADPTLESLFSTANAAQLRFGDDVRLLTDFDRFERRAQGLLAQRGPVGAAMVRRALRAERLYRGDAFPSVEGDWAFIERERLRNLYLDLLYRVATVHEERGELGEAIRCAQKLAHQDVYREDVHRFLMRAHVKAGNRAKAIAQYRVCEGEIGAGLGLRPMPETIELYEQLVALPDRRRAPEPDERRLTYVHVARNKVGAILRGAQTSVQQLEELDALLNRARGF
jgi:DNA-binding SARP family transcriptional activator